MLVFEKLASVTADLLFYRDLHRSKGFAFHPVSEINNDPSNGFRRMCLHSRR